MINIFETNVMTLQRDGQTLASGLSCQLDSASIPWNMEVGGLNPVPTTWYDVISIGWNSPIPQRGDYFIDESTGIKYSVFGDPNPAYIDHIEMRVAQYSGVTP